MTKRVACIVNDLRACVFLVAFFTCGFLTADSLKVPADSVQTPVEDFALSTERFERELAFMKGYIPDSKNNTEFSMSGFRDDFESISPDTWQEWTAEGTPVDGGRIFVKNGSLFVLNSHSGHVVARGIRTNEPVVAVPRISRGHFRISIDMDTKASSGGCFIITPDKSDSATGRSQIRISYSKDFKTGSFELFIDEKSKGHFFVPLVDSYELSVSLGFDGITLLDSDGKPQLRSPLPSWAAKGTSHYLTIGVIASPVVTEEQLVEVNGTSLSYPRRMAVRCPVYRCERSKTVIDDLFTTISDETWAYWAEGSGTRNTVTPSGGGLKCVLDEVNDPANPWSRMGLISREPVVKIPDRDNSFTVINVVIDTTFTSGARIALVSEPVQKVWGTDHIRFGMEKRGFYCQGWVGESGNLDALFDLPLSDECEVTILLGGQGIYVLDPSCEVVGFFPRPQWCKSGQGLYVILYGQASRPGESVAYLYKSLEVINDFCPVVEVTHVPIHKSSSLTTDPALSH